MIFIQFLKESCHNWGVIPPFLAPNEGWILSISGSISVDPAVSYVATSRGPQMQKWWLNEGNHMGVSINVSPSSQNGWFPWENLKKKWDDLDVQ